MQQTVYDLPHITNQYWTLLEMFILFILWHCSVALESDTPQACLLLGAVFLFPASPSALWSRLPLRWVTRTGEENMLWLLSSHSWWEPLFKPSWLPAYQEASPVPHPLFCLKSLRQDDLVHVGALCLYELKDWNTPGRKRPSLNLLFFPGSLRSVSHLQVVMFFLGHIFSPLERKWPSTFLRYTPKG